MADLQRIIGYEFTSHGMIPEGFRSGIVNAIRERGAVSKTVGSEIMTITITRRLERWDVVWKFESQSARLGVVVNASGAPVHVFKSYFSPWIISPAGVMKPSFGNGHSEQNFGGIKVSCGNHMDAQQKGGLLFAVSFQDRARRR